MLVSGLALLALWCGSATAAAHAVLVSSDPAYGSTIAHEPDLVSLTFDEPVTAGQDAVTLSDADGQRVDAGSTTTTDGGRTVRRHLRAGLPDGTYLLGWSLLSADGHLVSGSIVFGIGVPPDLSVAVARPDPLVAALDTIVRLLTGLGYAGVALAVGIPIVARLTWPAGFRTRAVPQLIRIGAATTALTALLIFAATPGRLAGSPGWGQPQVWAQATTTILGAAAVLRAAAATLLAFAASKTAAAFAASAVAKQTTQPSGSFGGRTAPSVVAGLVVIGTTAVSGHAVSGEYRWIAIVSTVLHLVAMAVWTGGVAIVLLVWRTPVRAEVVRRFGPVAASAVGVVVVTGVFQAWRAVDPVASLWSTSWGLLLLAKVALAGLAIVAALVVRRGKSAGFQALTAGTARRDRGWGVRVEFGLQVAVLVVSAVLTGVAPARETYDPATTVEFAMGPFRAEVAVDGAQVGRQEFTVRLKDSSGEAVAAQDLTGKLVPADGRVGAVDVVFRRVEPVEIGPDYFVSQRVPVPFPGRWELRLTVVADRVNAYAATVPYRVW